MPRRKVSADELADALRAVARAFPEVAEGTTCSKTAFKARNKSFLFLGEEDEGWTAMVKLKQSLDEAKRLEEQRPDVCRVGTAGWVTLMLRDGEPPPHGLLERWIGESFRLLAPKSLVAMLDSR